MSRGRLLPENIERTAPQITPVASPPSNSPLAALPRATQTAAEKLGPISETLARVAGAANRQKAEREARGQDEAGSKAFDAIQNDARGLLQENQGAWLKAVQAGAEELSNPHALRSYWRDVGLQLARSREMKLMGQWQQITSNLDPETGQARADRTRPEDFQGAAVQAISEAFDVDFSGLPLAAQEAFTTYRTHVEDTKVGEAVAAGVEALKAHNDKLKEDAIGASADTIFESGTFTEEELAGLTAQVEQYHREGLTNQDEPGKARRIAVLGMTSKLKQFVEADQPELGARALQFIMGVAPGGVPLGEDPKFTGVFENWEDTFQAMEEGAPQRRLEKKKIELEEQQSAAWEENAGRLRDAASPSEGQLVLQQVIKEMTESGKYGDNIEHVIENFNRRADVILSRSQTAHGSRALHDPKVVDDVATEIRTLASRSPEYLHSMNERLLTLLENGAIRPEDYDNLTAKVKEYTSAQGVRTAAIHSDLEQRLTGDEWDALTAGLSPERRAEFEKRRRGTVRTGLRLLEEGGQDARNAPDYVRYLEDLADKIEGDLSKERDTLLDEVRGVYSFRENLANGWARGMNMLQVIEENRGNLAESEYLSLLVENQKQANLDQKFFQPGGMVSQSFSRIADAFQRSDSKLTKEGESFFGGSSTQLSAQGLSLIGRVEDEYSSRVREWARENLPKIDLAKGETVFGTMQRGSRLVAQQMIDEFLPKEAEVAERLEAAEGDTSAEAITEALVEKSAEATIWAKLQGSGPISNYIPKDTRKEVSKGLVDASGIADTVRPSLPHRDYWGNLRKYTEVRQNAAEVQWRRDLDESQFWTAQRIMEFDGFREDAKHEAVLEMYKHRGLTPHHLRTGEIRVTLPRETLADIKRFGGKATGFLSQKAVDNKDTVYTVPFDPEDINPYDTPLWTSEQAFTKDLAERREWVEQILMLTGVRKEELPDVILAQRKTIEFHYRR